MVIKDRFLNYERVKQVRCPSLFIHGLLDDLVPPSHSKELHKKVLHKGSKLELRESMTHNDFDMYADIVNPLFDFWRSTGISPDPSRPLDPNAIAGFSSLVAFYLSHTNSGPIKPTQ